jgi:hypothetical protein
MKKLFLLGILSTVGFAAKITVWAPVPPPPMMEEKRPPAAGPGMVWLGGFWGYEGGRHVWHAGHWEKPPKPKAHYVDPKWDRKGSQYGFREGHWK